jgi:hypothetical protein
MLSLHCKGLSPLAVSLTLQDPVVTIPIKNFNIQESRILSTDAISVTFMFMCTYKQVQVPPQPDMQADKREEVQFYSHFT